MDNFELIIGDNASMDGTREVVKKFSKKDKKELPTYNTKRILEW